MFACIVVYANLLLKTGILTASLGEVLSGLLLGVQSLSPVGMVRLRQGILGGLIDELGNQTLKLIIVAVVIPAVIAIASFSPLSTPMGAYANPLLRAGIMTANLLGSIFFGLSFGG